MTDRLLLGRRRRQGVAPGVGPDVVVSHRSDAGAYARNIIYNRHIRYRKRASTNSVRGDTLIIREYRTDDHRLRSALSANAIGPVPGDVRVIDRENRTAL